MQYDRYYYSVLGDREKEVYKLIYKGIEKLDASIEIPARFCVGVDLADIIQKILLDNPHIFYVDRNGYKTTTTLFNLSIHFNKPDLNEVITYSYGDQEEFYKGV